jgi:hypothetical protein
LAAPIAASLVPLATLLVIQRGWPCVWAACCLRDWPWAPLRDEVLHLARDPRHGRRAQPERSFGGRNPGVLDAARALARETLRPPLYGPILYGGVTLANLIAARQGAPHTNSTLRYLLCAFPFAQALALYSWASRGAERRARCARAALRLGAFARGDSGLALRRVFLCFGRRWFLG